MNAPWKACYGVYRNVKDFESSFEHNAATLPSSDPPTDMLTAETMLPNHHDCCMSSKHAAGGMLTSAPYKGSVRGAIRHTN